MNRRKFIQVGAIATVATSVLNVISEAASEEKKALRIPPAELERITDQGAAEVAAVKPAPGPLSKGDATLMAEVAEGGMMQLEASRIAVDKATAPEVKALARAEVKEQTGLSKKLREVAAAKGAPLPAGPDQKAQSQLAKLSALSGPEFDRAYVKEIGIRGHELLDKVMDRVRAKAEDPTLKMLEGAAHPLVITHLQAARGEEKALA